MNTFLSRLHDTIRSARYTRRGATAQPQDVARFTHKEYPRMQRIALPSPVLEGSLFSALTARRSATSGDTATPLTLSQLGSMFGAALGTRGNFRNYPSGGALYPIETYLLIESIERHASGAYHYHPTDHALEYLWPLPSDVGLNDLVRPADFPLSALIVFTSVWARSSAKYGDLAYSHALLEAGHMSQNILLTATQLSLASRPMAGFSDETISRILDLDPLSEQPIHTITLAQRVTHQKGSTGNIVTDSTE